MFPSPETEPPRPLNAPFPIPRPYYGTRVYAAEKQDPWGPWEQKFRFYAFPAERVLFPPEEEDLNLQSSSLGGDLPAPSSATISITS